MRSEHIKNMKQILFQETLVSPKHNFLKSSTTTANCYVCGKGLKDGYSVTAKTLSNGITLFCDVHYSMQ